MAKRSKRFDALSEIRAARERAERLAESGTVESARAIVDNEIGNLGRSLRSAYRGKLDREVSPTNIARLRKAASAQVQRATSRLSAQLEDATGVASADSLDGLRQFAGRLTGNAGRLEDKALAETIAKARAEAIAKARAEALKGIQARVDESVRKRLIQVVSRDGATMGDAMNAVSAAIESSWHQVERVIRTEANYAYNAAQVEGVKALGESHPGMMLRWTELIDDATGQPFDERVAADSFAMHGQVAKTGGVFTMPRSLPRTARGKNLKAVLRMAGMSWYHPPNRPNDRAVLTPWMPDWDVPGWVCRGGRRVLLRTR